MRWVMSICAVLVFLASSGCAVIEKERTNRGGYIDYVLDETWMKADSKGMRALRAFAMQVSLARIASISAKNESDRQLLAVRIGALTKKFMPIYLCAFNTNPLGVPGAKNEPCFYYDSAMVEYANGLFDLAMVALPKDDAKRLFDTVSGAFVSPVNLIELLNALFAIARDAIVYGRTIGGLYRDSVELEVQLWIATPAVDHRPVPVTLDDVGPLRAIYAQRNDDMGAWLAAMAELHGRGLEPLPQVKFFGELAGLLFYICDQITHDPAAGQQCKYALPQTVQAPDSVLANGQSPILIGEPVRGVSFGTQGPRLVSLGGSSGGSSTSQSNNKGNTNTGGNNSGGTTNNGPLAADVTNAISKTRIRIAPLIGLLNKAGTAQTFSNKSVGDAGHQIALALADIDKQLERASSAVNRTASLAAEYQAVRTDLQKRISSINSLVTAVQSSGNVNKLDVARQIIGQVQGIEAVAGGPPALKGADALVNDGLVIVNKAGAGG